MKNLANKQPAFYIKKGKKGKMMKWLWNVSTSFRIVHGIHNLRTRTGLVKLKYLMKKPDGTDPPPPPDNFTTDTDRNTILMVNLKTSNGQIVNQNESILKEIW